MPVFFPIPWKYRARVYCSVVSTLGDPVDCRPPCVSYIGRRIFLPLASAHLLTVNIFTWPNKRLLFACYSLIF